MSTMPGPQEEPRRVLEPRIAAVERDDGDLARALTLVLRYRHWLVAVPAALAFVVALLLFLGDREWRSEASFVPQQSQRTPSAFAGIAAQFGFPLQLDGLDQSPAFYADLLQSREILQRVAQHEYAPAADGRGGTLLDHFEIDKKDPNERLHEAVERLRGSLRVSTDAETGVVSFSVAATAPALAQAVAQQLIGQVNTFNLGRRQSVAEAERTFVEERLEMANAELASAETALRSFDERNLRIDNSAGLQLQRDRLQRQVGMRQEVVTMLTQAYEQARIDEVRNTPAITVIERPSLPVRAAGSGAIQFGLLTFIVSAFLIGCVVFAREMLLRLQTGQTSAHEELRALRSGMRGWLPGRRKG